MDSRFQQVDSRFQQLHTQWAALFEASQAKWESVFEKGLREQTRFFFLGWSVLLAAIVGLYAR